VSTGGAEGDALRALVREVLADLLPGVGGVGGNGRPSVAQPGVPQPGMAQPGMTQPGMAQPGVPQPGMTQPGMPQPGTARPGLAQPGPAHTVRENVESVETVSLRSDADLDAFVMRLLHLLENPKHRHALRAGRLRFRLAPAAVPGSPRPAHRIEKGAVTESMVAGAARAGARMVLGRRAVLTPLARDRARAAGVEIERER
jgi:hypothetical protein